jgi:hypothetical protein
MIYEMLYATTLYLDDEPYEGWETNIQIILVA